MCLYCNWLKISPNLFLEGSYCEVSFSFKLCPPVYAVVDVVTMSNEGALEKQ